ncbi:hypothetical protein BVY04_05345 [bacterium M21]|nr:hypothetical protein BVY04_05345 [bacterium M21]
MQIAHTLLQLMVNSDMMAKLIREKYTQKHCNSGLMTVQKLNILVAAFQTILMAYVTVKNFAAKLSVSLQSQLIDDFALDARYARMIKVKLAFNSS